MHGGTIFVTPGGKVTLNISDRELRPSPPQ